MSGFEGKVAVVTGGASGIGRECVRLFARRGARVVIGDRTEAGAALAAEISGWGAGAVFVATDVTRQADCDALVAAAIDTFGRLDCAANFAGVSIDGGIFAPTELRDRSIAVNLFGVFNSVIAEAAAMKKSGGGAIVNCSSTAGLQAAADLPYYVAAKHGVVGFTKSSALELADHGIRVNAICPGFTRTPMTVGKYGADLDAIGINNTPLNRVGEPEEQAAAAVWLCSDEASFITGAVLPVDGGMMAGRKAFKKL